jgi:quercetin dioxygenase-like cupin family protein
MVVLNQKRRSVLLSLAGLGVGHALLPSAAEAEGAASQGYVLGPADGEHLVHFRNPGNIFIKVDPLKGSKNLAIGTQQVPVGAGIPIHIHFEADEAFYILEGSGSFILNDAPLPFEKGGTISHSQELLAWVQKSRSRTASALDGDADRPRCLFSRNL